MVMNRKYVEEANHGIFQSTIPTYAFKYDEKIEK
jgi:hypothetical protein